MQGREALVDSMCMTWRHDFCLTRREDDLFGGSGMLESERAFLRGKMLQLLEHHGEEIAKLYDQSHEQPTATFTFICKKCGANRAAEACRLNDVNFCAVVGRP